MSDALEPTPARAKWDPLLLDLEIRAEQVRQMLLATARPWTVQLIGELPYISSI
jgi:hypothetical protein